MRETLHRFLSMISFPTAFDFLSFDTERRISVDVLLRIFVFNMFATGFFVFVKRGETVLYEIILNIIISKEEEEEEDNYADYSFSFFIDLYKF